MRWGRHRALLRAACCAAFAWYATAANAADAGGLKASRTQAAASDASNEADIAEYHMRRHRYESPKAQAADLELYVQQVQTEAAVSRNAASAAEAKSRENLRRVEGFSDDLDVRKNLYESQAKYNLFIFAMVLLIVGAGLWFSFLQFTADRRVIVDLRTLAKDLKGLDASHPMWPIVVARLDGSASKNPNSFEAGPIKMSSSVIGLVVLGMSLAFFYLYVDRVYTIHPEQLSAGHDPPKEAVAKP